MKCPQVHLMLRSVAGGLTAEELSALDEHLQTCAICRAAQTETQAVWQALGRWDVEINSVDVTAAVLQDLDQADISRLSDRERVGFRMSPWRAAASIAFAALLGLGAGWVVSAQTNRRPPSAAVTPDRVAESLGLVHLGGDSPTGLARALSHATSATRSEQP